MADLPLSGVRVVDLGMVIAGPFATGLLGDMGAEVIKVEGPRRYDVTRGPVAPRPGTGTYPNNQPGKRPYNRASYFTELNRSKYSLILELSKPEGVEVFKRLVRISDVVLENFSPRVMRNFGLGYPRLKEVKPDIIVVSIAGYGTTGPYKDYMGYGTGIEAMTGLSELTGYIGGPPLKVGIAYGDPISALHAAAAVIAALRYRRKTGKGQYIEVSLMEALTLFLGEFIMDYTMNGRVQTRMGNRHPSMAPHGCYRCQGDDAWVTIAIGSDEEWRRLCQALGDPDWARDERFGDVVGRWEHQDEIDHHLEDWTRERDHYEVMAILQAHGVAAGPVLTPKELLTDPHLMKNGFFQWVTHPEVGDEPLSGMPLKFTKTPGGVQRPAPGFGEHNDYVLRELLGMPSDDIEELFQREVISTAPIVDGDPTRKGG